MNGVDKWPSIQEGIEDQIKLMNLLEETNERKGERSLLEKGKEYL